MLAKLKLYAIIGLIGFSVLSGGAVWYLNKQNNALKLEVAALTIARDYAKKNLGLVSDQLVLERKNRAAAEAALSDLREIPDVDFNTPLPPSVSNVLTDFADRMRNQN